MTMVAGRELGKEAAADKEGFGKGHSVGREGKIADKAPLAGRIGLDTEGKAGKIEGASGHPRQELAHRQSPPMR